MKYIIIGYRDRSKYCWHNHAGFVPGTTQIGGRVFFKHDDCYVTDTIPKWKDREPIYFYMNEATPFFAMG